ncbi:MULTISPECIES: M50 family metallopeptidase [unclassified Nocardioides]|uniref:M50 family metallopeptidase n=1 Tax=unclassified Nocardioides TaxID=2615069 RepID=UPI000B155C6C|nr:MULTISPECIES: M50 family metallopeptidase [unclassified Nocardioides]
MSASDVLSSIWDDVTGTQAALGEGGVLATAAVALLLVITPWTWPLCRHVVTIAHEGAHGLVALLTGRSLHGIRLHSDTSGLTVSRGKPRGPGMVATAFAGYAGPALLGLGAAYLLGRQHALAVLWLAVLLLALLLLQIRNFFGLYVVALAGVAVVAVSWWGSGQVQSVAAYVGTWFLLFAAPRPVVEVQLMRRRGQARTSDPDMLARLTGVPGIVWVTVLLAVTVGCLVIGGRWLWPAA